MEAVARGVLSAALERETLEAPVELELDRIQALGPLGKLLRHPPLHPERQLGCTIL